VHARDVFLQLANLLQTFGLPHLQLKLHLEQLISQLALLMVQFDIGKVTNLVYIHGEIQLSVASCRLSVSLTTLAGSLDLSASLAGIN
jgi:hypothetical protein